MSRVHLAAALLVCTACSSSKPAEKPVAREVAPPPAPTDGTQLAFEKYTLKNGLTVILHEDRRIPTVSVDVWYAVGSLNEPAGRSGFAHLFEHLMFQGSRHVGDDEHFRLLELNGASDVNGTTSTDRTNYFETVPREELPLALWLESDRMGFLLDTLDTRKLNNQREVVKNERRQSYEGSPYGMAELNLYETLFPDGHPYRYTPIGKTVDLDAARIDDVKTFFRTYYTPANATLTLAGDFDPAVAKPLIERAFGSLNGAAAPPVKQVVTPAITSERRVVVDEAVARLPRVLMAWLSPPIYSGGDVNLDVLSHVLSVGKGSRLYRALVEKTQLAQDVSAHEESMLATSIFTVSATVAPGKNVADVEAALDAELTSLATTGPTEAEVARARDAVELLFLESLERTGGMTGRAETLQAFNSFKQDPGYLPKLLAAYRAVTPESLKQTAALLLRKEARVVQHAIPKPGATPPPAPPPEAAKDNTAVSITLPPADPWRAKRPDALAPSSPALPVAHREVLENGITVLTIPQPALPLVSIQLVSRVGSAQDPDTMLGLNGIAQSMLSEGMEGGDAAAQSDRFADLGTALAVTPGHEASNVGVVVHKRNAPRALELLVKTVRLPTLNEDAMNRLKQRAATNLEEQLADPMGVVMHLAERVAVGPDHPYGHTRNGSVDGIRAVTLDAVKQNLAGAWVGKRMAVVVAGDVTPEEAVALVKVQLGDLPAGEPPVPAPPAATASKRTRVLGVEKAGAPQSMVVALRPSPAASDKDAQALGLLNAVFGGNFSSRLNMNLREDKGISYGSFSFAQEHRSCGTLAAFAPVQADATGVALKEMMAEISGLTTRPVTVDELTLARQSNSRALPGEFVGVVLISSVFARVYGLDLPLDHYATLPARYAAVTLEDQARLAASFFKADEMQLLLVGDKAQVEKAVAEAGLGTVTWVDAEGKPLAAPAAPAAPAKKKGKKK